ncbi:FAD-binding domain-containing protein [Lindgomyces ingoldianus]|uniref:FAD-binding domain-containing protein n=1 Tax=Lindgomyces ingoldianus TaxID=673940 RepID=A0ACB6QNP2_9PLEO|nr:FAD-binding domain-containing protein [Lindgomyces ingoldianus]KAF2467735.1 FAD-binding domain-containing protein [Lindgomyces ingoldianus]
MSLFLSSLLLAASLLPASQARTLFKYERVQLTTEYLQTLPEEDALLFAFENTFEAAAVNKTVYRCRYYPGDGKWPSEKAWTKLSKQLTTPDLLIKATPQAAVCYPGDAQNDAKCQQLTSNWTNSYTHVNDPTEILSPVYQGLTCQPPSIYNSGNCTLGGYPAYVVNVKNVLDIQVAINFARNDGVRLVVKNTGHDFAGKSAGAAALSIWTHGLKDIQFFDSYVDDSGYKGPAFKAGAGVQAFELYKAANDHGVVVVGGEGQTVGIMGGYIQGGGHSPLSSIYGMAADHVLGVEMVTPTGEFVTANSSSNTDLFYAVRGGGGSTFGVVTSVTVKAYPDMPVSAATWNLDSSKIGKDRFWNAVRAWVDRFNDNADAGIYNYFIIAPNGTTVSFIMQPFFAPNKTSAQVTELLKPYFSRMTSLNVPFSPKITSYKGFYPAWQAEFPLESQSDVQTAVGSRLFPRSNFASEVGRNLSFSALKDVVDAGQSIIAFNMAPTLARGGNPDNAVNPAWRTSVLHAITGRRWDLKSSTTDILSVRKALTNGTMQKWRDITPGSGSYLNEADRLEPNWQQSFWGDKYAKLLEIKKNWDKKDVFWAVNAVGSEGWVVESVDGLPNENGRLCKVNGTATTSSGVVGATPAPKLRAF